VLSELDGTISAFDYDTTTGRLTNPQALSTVPPGVTETEAAHVEVHPSGRFVYASNRANHNLAIYAVNPASGRLSSLGFESGGGMVRRPQDFAVDPDGQFLLVTNNYSRSVLLFRIQNDGRLATAGNPIPAGSGPGTVEFVPPR